MAEVRTQHPFHMYDAIQAQPEAFASVVHEREGMLRQLAEDLVSCDRLFLVGIGTSYHAAQHGEYLVRANATGISAQAWHAFDFALYGPRLTARDAVIGISHRGNKFYAVRALEQARATGCRTALITGQGVSDESADVVVHTVPQEASAAHTVSHVAAVAVLAGLAAYLGEQEDSPHRLQRAYLQCEFPDSLRTALKAERTMADLANAHRTRRRIWLVGGGPGAVAAREAALKILETSYLQAEGLSVEGLLHGPFLAAGPEDVFVLVAPAGPAQARVLELAGVARELGVPYIVVSDGTPDTPREDASGWCEVPAAPEPLAALTCLLPLQLFAYHLALACGTNPDAFRLDDPRFARARERLRL
jgi:glucosamine--fructose-6-phosphate aminotransferase (isomerizing)